MKLTTKQLKQMIRETLNEMQSGTQFGGELAVITEPIETQEWEKENREQNYAQRKMGYWRIQGTFNGREINIDSRALYGNKPTDIEQWEDARKSRYAMARELTGHLKMAVRAFDLNSVNITVNGNPVNKAKDYSHL